MEKIIDQVKQWEFLRQLPESIHGFVLITDCMACETQYRIFTYQNSERCRSFSVLYDKATKEYMVRIIVGLTEFCDITFITSSLEGLEKLLRERMEKTISGLNESDPNFICTQFRQKKIIEWPYIEKLPKLLAGFELYIHPKAPVKVINGSYIIIDYCDFLAQSNLMVYYNIFRDEFFGEFRIRKTPLMTTAFDAKSLNELEMRLESNLVASLESLRNRLYGTH
ncbi:MAG TPA: hypothetical protein PKA28_00155 [Methylomusa anaerophila]|uniref:Uncharacterized protein n=1 Tax=Methylomusa anaerophila TaxID=1930071 RepID=A0A348AQH9_9FIRM|nr:hypothetical protein [Methylomusa anaerophila]BBB93327.1 hypothetical protein MAMMFC1_04039 [Methylomusa anaerophila]HML86842.1 hypothetical protein [Methylomusa anaerophila]